MRAARLTALAFGLTLALVPLGATAQQKLEYADELVERSRELALADTRYWRLLLHYIDDIGQPPVSEADGPGFFNSPDGKHDPRAELEATLRAFFAPDPEDPGVMHPQCKFPARYAWLKEQLGFDPGRLPEKSCPRFERWRGILDPGSVTLIFASAYVNNPASMYGHTFLRLDKRDARPGSDLLSYIVNFSGQIPDDENGLLYAIRGLMGGYEGHFLTIPYYLKVQEYSNLESRELWEYRLAFTDAELERMIRHLWELGSTYFDYWFFDENCSYHLLSLIEIARPDLHLREQFRLWAIPTDTMRAVLAVPGLVGSREYRASRQSRMYARRAELDPHEVGIAAVVAERGDDAAFARLESLDPGRQAKVLDAAYDYLRFRMSQSEENQEMIDIERRLLITRGRLGIKGVEPVVEMPHPPEDGHASSRFGQSLGSTRDGMFLEWSLRPALHDFFSRQQGFEPDSELSMGEMRFRFDEATERFTLEDFEIVKIVSVTPVDPWRWDISWKARTGVRMPRALGCAEWECLLWDAQLGAGQAISFAWPQRTTLFAFVEGDIAAGKVFDRSFRIAPAASGGVLVDLTGFWRAGAEARYLWGFEALGDARDVWEIRATNSFYLDRNVEFRLGGVTGTRPDEVYGRVFFHF